MHGLLAAFGEAFDDPSTTTGKRPGDGGYLRRLLAGDSFIALAALQAAAGDLPAITLYDKLGTRSEVLHFDIAVDEPVPRRGAV